MNDRASDNPGVLVLPPILLLRAMNAEIALRDPARSTISRLDTVTLKEQAAA